MENFVIDDTLMHKRNGWVKRIGLDAKINGLWEYTILGVKLIVVHSGTSLKIYNSSTLALIKTINNALADTRSQSIFNDDKVFFIDGTNMKVLKYENNGYTLTTVEDNAYIPTTTIGITGTDATATARKTYESVNLLTQRRKNTLVGVEDSNSPSNHTYILDGIPAYTASGNTYILDESIRIDIKYLDGSTEKSTLAVFTNGATATVGASIQWTTEDSQNNNIILCCNIPDGEKLGEAWVILKGVYQPIITGMPNITINYKATGESQASKINKNTCLTTFGVNGNNDRLFLAGNPDYPNIDRWSEMDNFLYFPENNYCVCGTSQTRITGYTRLSDSVLAILKEESGQEASVYYRSGSWLTQDSDSDGVTEYEGLFPTSAGAIGKGLKSPYCVSVFNGDNLFMSNDGVYGLSVSGNLATTERYAKERSRSVNKALARHDLSKAVGFAYNNLFYVCVDNECFVADARYKYKASDDIDGSFNYEWYHLLNIPARVFANIGGELWFGTEDGNICAFDDEFSDRLWIDISFGSGSIATATDTITYSPSVAQYIKEGERVKIISGNLIATLVESCVAEDGIITTSATDILKFHNGQKIQFYTYNHNPNVEEYQDFVGTVKNLDKGNCTFEVDVDDAQYIEDDSLRIQENLFGQELYVKNLNTSAKTFKLARGKDDLIAVDIYNAVNTNIRFFYSNEAVVAKWYSGLIDLGTSMFSKTLLAMTVETEPIMDSKIAIGYDTLRTASDGFLQGNGYFDTEDFGFLGFNVLPELNSSYTVRLNERYTNYVRVRFISDNDADCGLIGYSIQYKINNKNKGVM